MKELFSIGPIHIYFFGLMIAIGIIAGSLLAIKQAEKRGITEDSMLDLIIMDKYCIQPRYMNLF